MIIIKIIFIYFIDIAHTDDFPSTGTRLVSNEHLNSTTCISIHYKHFRLLNTYLQTIRIAFFCRHIIRPNLEL